MFYLYILYSTCSDKYYVGYTRDYVRRLKEHNSSEGLTFTSKHRPWVLKAVFLCGEIESEAVRLDRFIKKQKSRRLLERLIDVVAPTGVLAQLVRVPYVRD
ncbi:putative endonuclease [Pedobacter xixiisoli]|uniref:Putative endonuclease n=2 Tax=Pedobacter xixiisoli TaxID=1476464 RepID=A0A286A0H0_9SPHI|nr:putative endonuclease [Pedobacter xixiisoli]